MKQVLAGIRVLDFGRHIAAPWCAALMADMGAEVIRVERLGGGEDREVLPLADAALGAGAMYLQCNRNKRSLTLDPKIPEGAEIMRNLVQTADVVIVNLPETTLKSLGLDYESLKAIKPDIILTVGTAYGMGGPYSDRIGFDGIGQIISGAIFRSGTPDSPMRAAVPYVDFGTAMSMLSGTLAALLHRQKTGEGQMVESALLATALMMSNILVVEQAVLKSDRVAIGNQSYGAAPSDIYKAKDGWVLAQIIGQAQYKRWCAMVGREEWFGDPRFATDDLRGENRAILNGAMAEWCAARTKAEVLGMLEKNRLPASAMYSPQDVLEDSHIAAMGYLHPMDYPGLPRPAPIMEAPFRLSATPGDIRMRAPLTGEHTEQILKDIGYDGASIAALRHKKAI